MTKKSQRTHPLDRDGDGAPGGSLPGNQTAPFAEGDPNRPDDGPPNADVTPPPPPTDTAAAPLQAAAGPDGLITLDDLAEIEPDLTATVRADHGEDDDATFDAEQIAAGDALRSAKPPLCIVVGRWADHLTAEDLLGAARDQATAAYGPSNFTLEMKGDKAVATPIQPDVAEDAAKAAATEGAVIEEEGETVAPPEAAAAPLEADGLVTLQTETAPVAVRLDHLRILTSSRRLYKSEHGYSSNYAPPYIDQATVDVWIGAGFAEDVPSAGNSGGVRVLPEARRALAEHTMGERA